LGNKYKNLIAIKNKIIKWTILVNKKLFF
jgi:hypothetical protein